MKKILVKHYKQLPIAKKILWVYLLLIVPILLVLVVGVTLILSRTVFENIHMSVNNNASIIVQQIEGKMQNAESCANMMLGYLNEIDFIMRQNDPGFTKPSELEMRKVVQRRMIYTKQVFSDVDGMLFISGDGGVYGDDYSIEQYADQPKLQALIEEMAAYGSWQVWFDVSEQTSLSKLDGGFTFTMAKKITDMSTGDYLGILFITIEEASVTSLFSQLKLTQNSNYILTDAQGQELFRRVGSDEYVNHEIEVSMEAGMLKGYFSGEEYLYAFPFSQRPIYLVFAAPVLDMLQSVLGIVMWICLIGLGCSALAVLLSIRLAKSVAQPILEMVGKMKSVTEGDRTVRFTSQTYDETRLLGDGFNDMLDTINNQFENIKQEQKQKRRFELALIQSQLKPHFLYNTLDTIYVLTHMNRIEEAKLATKSLAEFYRMALSSGEEFIPLASEIKCVQDYLQIQSLRFGDELAYSIEVDSALGDYSVPKMLLQPLVENAIYHGLREKNGTGHLRVYSRSNDESIQLFVEDDGIGMTLERLQEVMENETAGSFGLNSIKSRISLYFGEEYGVTASSIQGEGTVICVTIPKLEGEMQNA